MTIRSFLSRINQSTLILLLLLSVVLLSYSLFQYFKVSDVSEKTEHTYEVIQHSEHLIKELNENESNVRNFIISLNPVYRSEYDHGVTFINQEIAFLSELEHANSFEKRLIDTIHDRVKNIFLNDQTVFRSVNVSNRDQVDSLYTSQGIPQVSQLHGFIDELQSYEGKQLVQQKTATKVERQRFLIGIVSGIVILTLIMLFLFGKKQVQLSNEKAVKEELILTKSKLEEEVEVKETVIRRTAAELETTLSRITDGFLSLNSEGVCEYINKEAASIFRREPSDIIGKKIHHIFPKLYSYKVYEDFCKARESQRSLIGEQYESEWGKWYKYHIYPSEGGASLFFRDITDIRETEHQLKEQDELYRILVETALEGVVITDAAYKCEYFNQRMLDMVSLTIEDVTGRPAIDFIYEPDREDFIKRMASRIKGNSDRYITRFATKENGFIWVMVNSVPRMKDGQFIGAFAMITDITEEKNREQELISRNRQLELAESIARMGSWDIDVVKGKGSWSREMFLLLGLEPDVNPPSIELHLECIHPEDRAILARQIELMREGKDPEIYIHRTNPERGPVKYLQPAWRVDRDENGAPLRFSGTMLDVTDRIKNDEELKASEVKYRQLFESNPIAMSIIDVQTLQVLHVNQVALDAIGYSYEECVQLRLSDLIDVNELPRLLNEVPTLTEGLSNAGIWKHRKKNGELFDVEIFSHSLTYNGRPCRLVMAIDVTERVKNAIARAENEQRIRTIVENNPYGIFVVNADGEFLEANPAGLALFDARLATELHQHGISDFFKYEGKAQLAYLMEKVMEGRQSDLELEMRTLRGTSKWISLHGVPLKDTINNRTNILAVARDITNRKQAEKRIRDYQFALDQSAIIAISNREGKIFYINENFCRITGYTPDEVYGQEHRMFLPGKQYGARELELVLTIQKGHVWRGELREISKSGEFFWVDTTIIPFLDENGEPFQYLSIRFDITQRKEAEARQAEILDRYNKITKATHDVIWDFDVEKNEVHYNDNLRSMFGYAGEKLEFDGDWWRKKVHPDDLKALDELIQESIVKQLPTIQMEYRFRTAKGRYRHILDRTLVLYDEKGSAQRMIGAMQDVTQVKEQEKIIEKAIIQAQEKERQQIGMELHDNVNQILSASKLYLGMAEDVAEDKARLLEMSNTVRTYINSAITEIRKLSHQLAPSFFKDISLREIIQSLMVNLEEANPFRIHLTIDEKANAISKEIQVNLYRVIQEQLTNISKHADAKNCWVSIKVDKENVELSVKDDGRGFDVRKVRSGIGLENIKRRTKVFSGDYTCLSAPGKGCEIKVAIPLNAELPD